MTSVIKFTIATPEHIDLLFPLFRSYQAHYSQLTSASETQTRSFLSRALGDSERAFVILAWAESEIIGFAACYITVSGVLAERLVHLGDLYVDPKSRLQKIGTRLVQEVASEAKRREIVLVRWLSLASNTELNRWYQSLGASCSDFKLFLMRVKTEPNLERSVSA